MLKDYSKFESVTNYDSLQKGLDRLAALFINNTDKLLSESSILDLIEWTHNQKEKWKNIKST